ncbi:hypothetical protein FB2170_03485 [Maribacter sp. HTCC2170]|nr:hypothetical protein FB2170_03485 [Maribacter sp. HTCC2170]
MIYVGWSISVDEWKKYFDKAKTPKILGQIFGVLE